MFNLYQKISTGVRVIRSFSAAASIRFYSGCEDSLRRKVRCRSRSGSDSSSSESISCWWKELAVGSGTSATVDCLSLFGFSTSDNAGKPNVSCSEQSASGCTGSAQGDMSGEC